MSTPPVELVLAALRESGREPRPRGAGWICRCPAHDDRTPSLSVGVGDNGGAVVYCHAGCTAEAVVGAIGLTLRDLMPAQRIDIDTSPSRRQGSTTLSMSMSMSASKPASAKPSPDGLPPPPPAGGAVFASAEGAAAALAARHGPTSATWAYELAPGDVEGVVLRWDLPGGRKRVLPVSRRDGGLWAQGGMRTPRPLYRLPELAGADLIYVCEGEKACEAARAMGLVATTSAHGAGSAAKTDWSPLTGTHVVIVPDHDEAGERYAEHVTELLQALPIAPASMKIVRLPGLPPSGDLVEFLTAHGGDADAARAELERLVAAAEVISSPPVQGPAGELVYRPFPVDALPRPVYEFVAEGARAIGCDASFVALPMLAALATAVGHTRRLRLKRSWSEPAVLWVAIVGESGTQKTPAFKLVLRPLREAQEAALKRFNQEMEDYERRTLQYEAELAAWKREAGKGDGGEPPLKPEPPVALRYIVSDTTVEALAPILQGNGRGVLLARDELSGWMGSFDRYAGGKGGGGGGGDVAHWLSMHNAEPMTVDRKSSARPIHVPAAAVSVVGGIQPGILRRALGHQHRENGLAARLLMAYPPRRAKRWTESDLDERTEAAVEAVIAKLMTLEADRGEGGEPRPRMLTLSPEAKAAWIGFYNEHAQEQVGLSGDLSAAWSKLEAYAPRLALIVHLVRWAAGDMGLEDADVVDELSMASAITLVRWFAAEARRIYAMLEEGEEKDEQRRLVDLVRSSGGAITPRGLMRASNVYNKGRVEAAEGALDELARAGLGRWVTDRTGGRGRPARRFVLRGGGADGIDIDTNGADADGGAPQGPGGNCVNVNGVNAPRSSIETPPAGDLKHPPAGPPVRPPTGTNSAEVEEGR